MHKLLADQLRQAASGPDGREVDWKKLIELIDAAYTEADDQRRLLEQSRHDVAREAEAATAKHRQIEQELRHNEAQLWVVLEKLRTNEARFRDFTDAASDGYWELDSELRYAEISPMPRVAGRGSLDDYLGKHRWDLVDPAEQDESWHRHLDDLKQHRPFRDVRQFRKLPNGRPHYVNLNGKPIFDASGAFRGYRGTATDITSQVLAQQAAASSRERLEGAVEGLNDGFIFYDPDGLLVICNSAYRRLHDYISDALIPGTHISEIVRRAAHSGVYQDSVGREEAWIAMHMEKLRASWSREVQLRGGQWLRIKTVPLSDGSVVGIHSDITNEKRHATDLAASEARFRDFTEAASDWYWETGPDLRFTDFSDNALASGGHRAREYVGKYRWELVDVNAQGEDWKRHIDDMRNHRPFRDIRQKNRSTSGPGQYLKLSGKPIFDASGAFRGYRGTATDITTEVLAEQQASKAQKLLAEAVGTIPEGIAIYDAERRFVLCNEHLRRMYPLLADLLVPGVHANDILRAFIDRRQYIGLKYTGDEFIKQRAERRQIGGTDEFLTADGRHIRTFVSNLPSGAIVAVHSDITAEKHRQAELADLASRNALFAAAFDTTTSAVTISDGTKPDRPIVYVNPAFTRITGYPAADAVGRNTSFLHGPRTDFAIVEKMREAMRAGLPAAGRMLNYRKDGSTFYFDIRIHPVRSPDGKITHFVGVENDVTAEVEAHEALRESEERLRGLAGNVPGIIFQRTHRPDGTFRFSYLSERCLELSGDTAEELIRDPTKIGKRVHPDDARAYHEEYQRSIREMAPGQFEFRFTHFRTGEMRWARSMFKPRAGANGDVLLDGVIFDVTAEKQAIERLRENEARLRNLADNVPGIIFQRTHRSDGSFYFSYMSEHCYELSGDTAEDLRRDPTAVARRVHPEDVSAYREVFRNAIRDMKSGEFEFRFTHLRTGEMRWARSLFKPRHGTNGDVLVDGVVYDVTEEKRRVERLRENEAQLRGLATNVPGVLFQRVVSADGTSRYTYLDKRIESVTGYAVAEFLEDWRLIQRILVPEDLPRVQAIERRATENPEPLEYEHRFVSKTGEIRWGRVTRSPRWLPTGELVWDGVMSDITDRKKLEQQRQDLENQIRHMQRIEAIGTLAGGIAHDINNTLVPIIALTGMALDTLKPDDPNAQRLDTVKEAAERIRDLVRKILAFSRKESPQSQNADLATVIADTVNLLRATLPVNIRLNTRMTAKIDPIRGDAAQLVQALMNLCTNSAHAIGRNQGRIDIDLDGAVIANNADAPGVPPGSYARITITDNGCGMDAATLQHIYEPFFTTKGVGEGTGLGLSVVHGIVSSHRGHIVVSSEVERGTTFRLFLPFPPPIDPTMARAAHDHADAAQAPPGQANMKNAGAVH